MTPTVQPAGYQLERELGSGGMAKVYLATQRSLGRRVALKLLSRDSPGYAKTAQRFLREARTLAELKHRNIVTVYDVVHSDEADFIAMKFLDGGSLSKRSRGGLSFAETLGIVAQLADALGHAHAAGVVHRDVKPDNVLFRDDRTPVLTDFGIARPSEAPRITEEGIVVGTPAYMSPEQIEGRECDGRTDFYSLGVMFFELLTGSLPFQAASASEWLTAHLVRRPAPLPASLAALQPVLDRLLAKSAAQRYPDAAVLLQDCRQRLLDSPDLLSQLSAVRGTTPSERLQALGFADTGAFSAEATQRLIAATPLRSADRRNRVLGAVAMLLVFASVAWWYWTPRSEFGTGAPPIAAPSANKPRLAVLPFADLSPEVGHEYFAEGLHDEVLTALARLGALDVISRTSTVAMAERKATLTEIANILGASHVLEGSVRREGKRVRLGFQLLDARRDDHLWAERYDYALEDALGLQATVANAVTAALRLLGAA